MYILGTITWRCHACLTLERERSPEFREWQNGTLQKKHHHPLYNFATLELVLTGCFPAGGARFLRSRTSLVSSLLLLLLLLLPCCFPVLLMLLLLLPFVDWRLNSAWRVPRWQGLGAFWIFWIAVAAPRALRNDRKPYPRSCWWWLLLLLSLARRLNVDVPSPAQSVVVSLSWNNSFSAASRASSSSWRSVFIPDTWTCVHDILLFTVQHNYRYTCSSTTSESITLCLQRTKRPAKQREPSVYFAKKVCIIYSTVVVYSIQGSPPYQPPLTPNCPEMACAFCESGYQVLLF